MRVAWCLLALAACGRLEFSPAADASATSDALPSDLIAYYPMDGLSGTTLVDATGHGHDGVCTIARCPVADAGIRGTALRFDGVNDIIAIPSTTELETRDAYTVALWLRKDQVPTMVGCLVSKRVGAGDGNSWQLCVINTLDVFFSSWPGSGGNIDTYASARIDTAWHHVALVYDGSTEHIVIDGVADVSLTQPALFDAGEILFGADIDSGVDLAFFSGWLDDIRIYNRALTAAELTALAL